MAQAMTRGTVKSRFMLQWAIRSQVRVLCEALIGEGGLRIPSKLCSHANEQESLRTPAQKCNNS